MSKTKTEALSTAASFDLDAVRYGDEFKYPVKHPVTGEETTWIITLAGPGHPQTLDALEEQFREEQEEEEKRQQESIEAVKAGQPVPRKRATIAELKRTNAKRLAARIVSSTPVRINGQDLVLNKDTAVDILADAGYEWLFNQISLALGVKANFIVSSAQI
jgi:hypothetical protein